VKMKLEKAEQGEYGLPYEQEDIPTKRQRYGVVTLVLVSLILIIVLFILYANIDTHKTVKNYSMSTISSIYSDFNIPTSAVGYSLSLAAAGKAVLGGGTSVYKNIIQFTPNCPKYLSADTIFSSHYLMSYYDSTLGSSTINLLSLDSPQESELVATSTLDSQIFEIATLDGNNGLFVGINQDMDANADKATVVAGKTSAIAPSSFSYGSPVNYGGEYSVDPAITRLSDNSFAISYFDTDAVGTSILVTRYGVVNPSDLSITLSNEVVAGLNIGYALHHSITGLTATRYLIGYYNGTIESSGTESGPLSVMAVSVNGQIPGEIIANGQVNIISTSTLENTFVAFNIASDRIDNSSAIFTFADVSTNFGLTSIIVSIDSNSLVTFGSSISFSSGRTLSLVQTYLLMDLDVVVISNSQSPSLSNPSPVKFLILYSDISNGGALTTTAGMITRSGELVRVSPDFLLNSGNPNTDTFYTWGALAVAGSNNSPENLRVVIANSLTKSTCTSPSTTSVSSIHMMPSPYGVAITGNTGPGSISEILLSGSYSIPGRNDLKSGGVYLTNTVGEIIGGDVMFGSDYSTNPKELYYSDEKTDTLIDIEKSFIGVAIDSSTINLKLD